MADLRKAAQMALEALENHEGNYKLGRAGCERQEAAITAIKEALAQPPLPEQEPLEYWNAVEGWVKIDEVRKHFDAVNCGTIYKHGGEGRVPLYTAPAQRPWVGLTEDEKFEMAAAQYGWEDLLIAAEARLKEKNK